MFFFPQLAILMRNMMTHQIWGYIYMQNALFSGKPTPCPPAYLLDSIGQSPFFVESLLSFSICVGSLFAVILWLFNLASLKITISNT